MGCRPARCAQQVYITLNVPVHYFSFAFTGQTLSAWICMGPAQYGLCEGAFCMEDTAANKCLLRMNW